jgi:hypothetical protein
MITLKQEYNNPFDDYRNSGAGFHDNSKQTLTMFAFVC